MSFVSFQRERERLNFFRSTDNLGTRERERARERERECRVGAVEERERGAEL